MGVEYAAVPQSEQPVTVVGYDEAVVGFDHSHGDFRGGGVRRRRSGRSSSSSLCELAKRALVLVTFLMFGLVLGYFIGRRHAVLKSGGVEEECVCPAAAEAGVASAITGAAVDDVVQGLLPATAFVPEIPLKGVQFQFPTPYEDTGVPGDMLWNALMPKGSGFVRVPNPRQYDMPASKSIENDPDSAEIYSLSALHQLHCLGVIRDVVIKYAQASKSRFAGAGHEYHCIDYLRQSIMCAGDTTLDFAELQADGTRRGFTGANSTHTCRDWDALVEWAVANREGDKMGIA